MLVSCGLSMVKYEKKARNLNCIRTFKRQRIKKKNSACKDYLFVTVQLYLKKVTNIILLDSIRR